MFKVGEKVILVDSGLSGVVVSRTESLNDCDFYVVMVKTDCVCKYTIKRESSLKEYTDEIKVDDWVRITDAGQIYTTATTTLLNMVKDGELLARYAYGDADFFALYGSGNPVAGRFKVLAVKGDRAYISRQSSYTKCYLVNIAGLIKY